VLVLISGECISAKFQMNLLLCQNLARGSAGKIGSHSGNTNTVEHTTSDRTYFKYLIIFDSSLFLIWSDKNPALISL